MAGLIVGEAFLGLALSVLYKFIENLIKKNLKYGSILEDIIASLDSFKPLVQQMTEVYSEEELQDLVEVLQKGTVLVGDYLVHGRDPRKKDADKFAKWEKLLKRQLEMLNIQSLIESRKTAVITEAMAPLLRDTNTRAQKLERIAEELLNRLDLVERKVSADNEAYCAVPELPPLTVGLDVPLKELKTMMFEDGKSMVVVNAMGGSGKTTLATYFCRDPEVKEKFKNNIFFVTVSKNLNLELIVQELYQRKGLPVPAFTNQENAVTRLQIFLKEKKPNPLLLVLDDVWSQGESVLGKFKSKEMKDDKILVTSRSQLLRYCSQDSQYKLKLLNGQDALALFNHSTNSSPDPKLSETIVKSLKGLPLALTVAGGSLSNQPIDIWRKRVIDLSKGHSIIAPEAELSDSLQRSLDDLDENTKEYFLDLGAFSEDERISVGALIDMWAELYDLTPDRAVKARCVDGLTHEEEDTLCNAELINLKSRNLVNLVDTRKDKIAEDGYRNGDYVILHDLLRDLIIRHSGLDSEKHTIPEHHRKRLIVDIRGNNIPGWTNQEYQARLLSVSTDSVFSKELPNMTLKEAEILILNFRTKKYTLPEFVESMRELKVLLVRYDGSSHAELDKFKQLGSLPNLKRIRLERISIQSIRENPFILKSLLKMSLFMCDLSRAVSNGCVKISDAFPKLEELNIDQCSHWEEFFTECCDLVHLTKLGIINCGLVSLPEGIGSLVKLEVLRLRSCTDLSIFPDSVANLKELKFLDISGCSSISKLPENIGEMSSLTKLDTRHCAYMDDLPQSVLHLKQLEEVICSHKTKKLWEAVKPSLRRLRIVAMPLTWSDFYY